MNNQYRIMPVEPTPAIKDAIRESGCPMPETMWAAIIARHDLVSGQQAPIQSGELADGIEGDPTLDNILDRMLKYSGQEYGDGEVRKCYEELCEFIDNRAAPAAQQQASTAQEQAAIVAVSKLGRQIPDAECVQSKCACPTTGCWNECHMRRNQVLYTGSSPMDMSYAAPAVAPAHALTNAEIDAITDSIGGWPGDHHRRFARAIAAHLARKG